MIISREINTYCPKCNAHTAHTVKIYPSSTPAIGGFTVGKRRHDRKLIGYHGKVKGQATVKKLGKKRKVILTCKVCNYAVERVVENRTRKKLELKMS
ncbi:MAG: 50S ribosomal protein L44e [Candidatus Micrarchaeia archaeon]